jgi:NAD-dependent deacetylase
MPTRLIDSDAIVFLHTWRSLPLLHSGERAPIIGMPLDQIGQTGSRNGGRVSSFVMATHDAQDTDVTRLGSLLAGARRIVAFTGAGISTESGIPDFRSPGGVWDRNQPIEFRDFMQSAEARRETWRRGLETYPVVAAAEPNAAHRALVELEQRGVLMAVITQNIDGLHLEAGHEHDRVIELHGNAHGVQCLRCDGWYPRSEIHDRVLAGDLEPACSSCDGILKPTTVSFGQPMPREPLRRAETEVRQCDLVLVVGSSLVVYPAAGIPRLGLMAGAKIVIVNSTPTPLDDQATLVVRGRAGELLPAAIALAAIRAT